MTSTSAVAQKKSPETEAEWEELCEDLYPGVISQCRGPLEYANDKYLHNFFSDLEADYNGNPSFPRYEYLVHYLRGVEKMWFEKKFEVKVMDPPGENPKLPELPTDTRLNRKREIETTQSPIGITDTFCVLMKSLAVVDTIKPSRQERRSAGRNREKNAKLIASGKPGLPQSSLEKDKVKKEMVKSVSRLFYMPTDLKTIISSSESPSTARPWWFCENDFLLENVEMVRLCKGDYLVSVSKMNDSTCYACSLYKLSIGGFSFVHTIEGLDNMPSCIAGGEGWIILGYKEVEEEKSGAFLYTSRTGWKNCTRVYKRRIISLDIELLHPEGGADIGLGYILSREDHFSITGVVFVELRGCSNSETKFTCMTVDHRNLFQGKSDYPRRVVSCGSRRGAPRKTVQTGVNTIAFDRRAKDPENALSGQITDYGSAIGMGMSANVVVVHHLDNNIIIHDFAKPNSTPLVLSPEKISIPTSECFYNSVSSTTERVGVLLPSGHVLFLCLEPASQTPLS